MNLSHELTSLWTFRVSLKFCYLGSHLSRNSLPGYEMMGKLKIPMPSLEEPFLTLELRRSYSRQRTSKFYFRISFLLIKSKNRVPIETFSSTFWRFSQLSHTNSRDVLVDWFFCFYSNHWLSIVFFCSVYTFSILP